MNDTDADDRHRATRIARAYWRPLWIGLAVLLLLGGFKMWQDWHHATEHRRFLADLTRLQNASDAFQRQVSNLPIKTREQLEAALPDPRPMFSAPGSNGTQSYIYRDPQTGGGIFAVFANNELMVLEDAAQSAWVTAERETPLWDLTSRIASLVSRIAPMVLIGLLIAHAVIQRPQFQMHMAFLMLATATAYAVAQTGLAWEAWSWSGAINQGMWYPACALAVSLIVLWFTLRRRTSTHPHACITCGYDLRATPDRCPECGTVVETSVDSNAIS
jgi:hypothetical protein